MVQVYTVNVSNITQQEYEILYSVASPDRRLRADRCRRRENAVCYLAAEALLRYAVKSSLGLSRFTIETNPCGKPSLMGCPDFHFNLSHSGHWVVLACGSTEVGIDVEKIRIDEKNAKIACRFFTQEEQRFVFEKEESYNRRFLEIWTAKESYLKYLGTGMKKSLNSFDVCTMTEPRFDTFWLEDACVSLCTAEQGHQVQMLDLEALI